MNVKNKKIHTQQSRYKYYKQTTMESNTEGNLLEVMDLARTLRQEQLFIQQEQTTFAQLTETLAENSASITKVSFFFFCLNILNFLNILLNIFIISSWLIFVPNKEKILMI